MRLIRITCVGGDERMDEKLIVKIAKNITIDYFRKTNRIVLVNDKTIENNANYNENPYDNLFKRCEIENALISLSVKDAQIVVLYAVCGFLHREIAEILSTPEGTVRRRYRAAIKQLAKEIGGEYIERK